MSDKKCSSRSGGWTFTHSSPRIEEDDDGDGEAARAGAPDGERGDVGLGREEADVGRESEGVAGLLARTDDADESEALSDCRLLDGVLMPAHANSSVRDQASE